MYGDVLVPLDGSAFAEHALPAACGIARATGASLHLVLVHEHAAVNAPDAAFIPMLPAWEAQSRARERRYLEQRAEDCRRRGLSVDLKIVDGRVPDELCRLADSVDLVVMASHGRGGLQRLWVGSVADTVRRRAGSPVLVVRPRGTAAEDRDAERPLERPGKRVEDGRREGPGQGPGSMRIVHILAATGTSDEVKGDAAVQHAADLARALDARLTLLTVVEVPSGPTSTYIPHAAHLDRQVAETRQAEAHRHLRRAARAYPDVAIAARVWRDSSPARGILRGVEELEPDLVVVGAHRKTRLGRALLGSVSDEVVRKSDVPVLVVGPATGARPRAGTRARPSSRRSEVASEPTVPRGG